MVQRIYGRWFIMDNTINLGGYNISFMGTMANGDSETWIYKVTKNDTPNPPISKWGIELCFNPLHKVLSVTGPTIARLGSSWPYLPFEGNGVIWENLNNENVSGIYTFTLKGKHQKAPKQVAVYTGELCHTDFITGPSCEIKVTTEMVKELASSLDDFSDDSGEVKNEPIIEKQESQQRLQEKKTFYHQRR